MTIKYNFFGKNCLIDRALEDRSNLKRALEEKDFRNDKILFVNQVHGNDVVVVDSKEKIHGEQGLPKADALVTNLKNIVIGVVTADCSPILFFDEEKNIIAAAHAGWRGAKLGVIQATINAMKKIGAKNIKAIVGPMICQKSYEVSKEFFDDFLKENQVNQKFFKDAIKPDKYMFDLPGYVEEILRAVGIKEIENLKIDTYENEKDFFSFRRSTHLGEADCGRNISVIVIN